MGWAAGAGRTLEDIDLGCSDPFNLAPVDQCVKVLFKINLL